MEQDLEFRTTVQFEEFTSAEDERFTKAVNKVMQLFKHESTGPSKSVTLKLKPTSVN